MWAGPGLQAAPAAPAHALPQSAAALGGSAPWTRVVPLRNMGAALAPLNAFLILQGIETLALRMERICDNALAQALDKV